MDNVVLNQSTTVGATIATDEVGLVQHQLVKVEYGVDGVATMVSADNPLPVNDAILAAKDFATQTTLAAILAKLIADPATQTTLAAVLAKLSSDPATQTTLAALLTELQLKADLTETQPVSLASIPLATGAAIAANQQTDALTNTQLRAVAVPVSGTVTANTGLSQPLTDAQLRATPVPVSGTVTTGGLTDTQLRATPVPTHDQVLDDVIGTVGAVAPSKVVLIGAIDAAGNVREPLLLNTNFDAQPATDIALLTSTRLFGFNGTTWDRLRIDGSDNLQVNVNSALPTGTNNIGDVDIASIAAGSAIIGKVGIDQTTPGTTNKVSLSDTAGQAQYNFPAGFVRTSDEPRQIFYDPFDKSNLDYVNKWKSPFFTDGSPEAAVNGGLIIDSSIVANSVSYLESLPTFTPPIPGWLGISFAIQLEAVPITNANRFWGIGTSPTAPTATAPLTNAIGFELYTDGKLYAVVYASGVRTVVADLSSSGTNTQPLDGLPHRYILYYRTDRSFFYFDSLATPVASTNFQSPTIQTLPMKFHAIAGSTPPSSSAIITCLGAVAWDTAKNSSTISDGTNPFYKAKVNYDGELSVIAGVTASKTAPFDITGERALNVKSNEIRQTQEDIYLLSYSDYMISIAGTRGFELR